MKPADISISSPIIHSTGTPIGILYGSQVHLDGLQKKEAGGQRPEASQVTTGSGVQDVNSQAVQGREDEAMVATTRSIGNYGHTRTITAKVGSNQHRLDDGNESGDNVMLRA